ncbi:MAG: hypothetical protein Q9165_008063 [Trypethelium subeluteriae]
MGTGMKCLPVAKVARANGNVLHDGHAETVAIRAFNRFLIEECAALVSDELYSSKCLVPRSKDDQTITDHQPFQIHDDVGIYMYCSEAPCGDASMELTMEAQKDATPWSARVQLTGGAGMEGISLLGRGHFSELGVVRRKPSRPDAPATLSKSCTDKIALKQCTSLLNSLTTLLVHPRNAYISSLILPASQHVPQAVSRAFGALGRFANLKSHGEWSGGYRFCPFRVQTTTRDFAFSRRCARSGQRLVPSNLGLAWTPDWEETLVGGMIQGRKQGDPKGASKICRRGLSKAAVETTIATERTTLTKKSLREGTYGVLKKGRAFEDRMQVKQDVKREVLQGWVQNIGDEDFELYDGDYTWS